MLRINIVLVFCIIGLCAAATTPKPKTMNKMKKDVKEKRDAAVTSGPYSYNSPQKSFQDHGHLQAHHPQAQQQKVAPIEYHQKQSQVEYYQVPQKQAQVEYQIQTVPQKPSSLDYFQHKQPIHVAPQHDQIQYSFPSVLEGYDSQAVKGLGDYGFSYPGLESFQQMPIEHYNAELDKISQALVTLQGYKVTPSYYKSPYPQESYSYGQGYDFPQSYQVPQQPAPSAPEHYGFVQSPAALFIPQTVSISPKPTKTPDYASGVKGLGHFSTVSAVPVSAPAPTQSAYKQSYEVPAYKPQTYEYSYKPQSYESYKQQSYEAPASHVYNHYQTERPFKASAYLGSSSVDSHSEQSIASHKPSAEYLPPSKTYLPAKEPVKTYLPAREPAREPAKTYLPAKDQYTTVKEQYTTVKEQYTPAKEQYKSSKVQYVPAKEQYIPSSEQYSHEQSPVEYQIQYVQIPTKSYLPPSASSYTPPKSVQEAPKSSYLPPAVTAAPQKQYLPPSQPSNNYLPPNNPYQSSYHTSSSHPSQYQQFHSESSYETQEYKTVSASGHK